MKKKKFTKIRENITETEYQKLLTYLNGKDINTIFEKEELIIVTYKTRKERKLFFSKEAIKQIKKHFVFNDDSKNEDFIITTKGYPLKTPSSSTFIAKVNSFIQEVLGHSDIKTTMRYIRPTDEDLKKCLIR